MNPSDIVVGQFYKNNSSKLYKEHLYLGVGKRIMWEGTETRKESNFKNKELVILAPIEYRGMIVQSPEDCEEGFWDYFEKVN